MKWVIIALLILGGLLIGMGLQETNNTNQSADVREGGSFLIIGGCLFVILSLILAFAIFLVNL